MTRTRKHGVTDCRRIFARKATIKAKRKGMVHNRGTRRVKKHSPVEYYSRMRWKLDATRRDL